MTIVRTNLGSGRFSTAMAESVHLLGALRARASLKLNDPKTHILHLLVEGVPGRTILKAAREKDSDLIVMGTQGRTGLNRLLVWVALPRKCFARLHVLY